VDHQPRTQTPSAGRRGMWWGLVSAALIAGGIAVLLIADQRDQRWNSFVRQHCPPHPIPMLPDNRLLGWITLMAAAFAAFCLIAALVPAVSKTLRNNKSTVSARQRILTWLIVTALIVGAVIAFALSTRHTATAVAWVLALLAFAAVGSQKRWRPAGGAIAMTIVGLVVCLAVGFLGFFTTEDRKTSNGTDGSGIPCPRG